MKRLFLAAVLSTLVSAGALAEDNRDQAFGKHDMGPSPDSNIDRNNTATGTQGMAIHRSASSKTARHSKKADR
jgi:hypothetical protein